jgi:hypothetical protein
MRKMLEIDNCYKCTNFAFYDDMCMKTGEKIKKGKIPKACPLPNAPTEGAHCEDK